MALSRLDPTALVADDEPALARALVAQLQQVWPALRVVHVARNGIEAAERIAALQPDFAFLDIQMPGLTGLQVAEGIEGPTQVVFVTAFDAYAVEAFDREALDYLLKPVAPDRLARTVQRIQARQARGDAADAPPGLLAALRALQTHLGATVASDPASPQLQWIRAGTGDRMLQVAVDDVLFFRADDKYTVVQTPEAEHLIRMPIAELARQLDPARFAQVHRSTIVNLARLQGSRRDEVSRLWLRLKDWPEELPVSRAYVHLFKAM